MSSGKTITFVQLFDEVERVEVPIIQRDYAQGRGDAKEIRDQFLLAIKNVLLTEQKELKQPLDLDFIYGSLPSEGIQTFSLLDGQQRLTTLFLLHWYLANKGDQLEEFSALVKSGNKSRFTYQTRPSSTEFFDALLDEENNISKLFDSLSQNDSLATRIEDCQWFYLSWGLDPTIKSCLIMLDSIHELFSEYTGFYEKLVQADSPYITFQFLNLKEFGLSDELYIKMNARGKALSKFENFKAWLVGHVDRSSFELVPSDIDEKIDMEWTDIFWQMRAENSSDIDDKYLKFFKLMALLRLCEKSELKHGRLDTKQEAWMKALRSIGDVHISDFAEMGCFDEELLSKLYSFLEFYRLHAGEKQKQCFNDALLGNNYYSQARFYALFAFISKFDDFDKWDDSCVEKMIAWTRVTSNLINNTRIDDSENLTRAIQSMQSMSDYALTVYATMSTMDEKGVDFFSRNQSKEEMLKSKLIEEDSSWLFLFLKFEKHNYFYGQIGFLLEYASLDNGKYDQNFFENYGGKAGELFSYKLIETRDFLLQRALLSVDNYLIRKGTNTYSFCEPSSGTARLREENWRKVFGTSGLKKLLDSIDGDVTESLREIIGNAETNDWRQYFIKYPEAISYCKRRLINRSGGEVYLLTKSTLRGYFAELKSYVLYLTLNTMRKDLNLSEVVKNMSYVSVYGDEIPYIEIDNWEGGFLTISFEEDGYPVCLHTNDGDDVEFNYKLIPDELISLIDKVVSIGA